MIYAADNCFNNEAILNNVEISDLDGLTFYNGEANCSKPDIAVDSQGFAHITYTVSNNTVEKR